MLACVFFACSTFSVNNYIMASFLGSVVAVFAFLTFFMLALLLEYETLVSSGIKLAGIIMVVAACIRLAAPIKAHIKIANELFQVKIFFYFLFN